MTEELQHREETEGQVTDRILTPANVITFIRLCMVPVAFVLLLTGNDVVSAVVFGLTAFTDFVDGQVARRTNTVSKLGQLLDPAVDRLLMIAAVLGLLVLGRLPLWMFLLVVVRDLTLLIGGWRLLSAYRIRVPVVYAGKVATTFLFLGCAGLILNVPLVAGLGWVDASWLPGFNSVSCSWGIWCIYLGLCIGVITTIYYVVTGFRLVKEIKAANR